MKFETVLYAAAFIALAAISAPREDKADAAQEAASAYMIGFSADAPSADIKPDSEDAPGERERDEQPRPQKPQRSY